MPTVQPGSKVLVSGANGYIAIWVVRALLEQGYAVRGAVRSEAKGEHLKKSFEKYGDKFEIVVVDDITKVRADRNCHSSLICVRRLGWRIRRGRQGYGRDRAHRLSFLFNCR